MIIYVNGIEAFLKQNTSFDYIVENSLFTGSDSYTLAITFPLKDCPLNREIFGPIDRKDVDKDIVVYDCEIRDKEFWKSGTLTITEVSDVEVKGQFLEGRSEQNYDVSFDDIYINEVPLGYPSSRSSANNPPTSVWAAYPDRNCVALPWVNNTSGNLQNELQYANNAYSWNGSFSLTFQPYLLHVLKTLCSSLHYTYDFSELEASEFKYLLICNTLPAAWEAFDFAHALPHWSVTEFLEELEKFLMGEFLINHRLKRIEFRFFKTQVVGRPQVMLDQVVNHYTTEISKDKGCEYIKTSNYRYSENDNRYWAYRDCPWFLRDHGNEAVVFSTLSSLLQFASSLKESGVYINQGGRTGGKYTRGYDNGSDGHKLFYAQDVDQYFIMFCYDSVEVKTTHIRDEEYHWYKYFNRLEPINQFGKIIYDEEATEVELNIVPAWLDDTDDDKGLCLFLECGEMGSINFMDEDDQGEPTNYPPGFGGSGSVSGNDSATTAVVDETDYNEGALAQSKMGKLIEKGEKESSDEYFDKLYVGYWDGTNRVPGKYPHPFLHTLETTNEFTSVTYPYSLSLERNTTYYGRSGLYTIDGKKKYHFSFLADKIPDVKALFNIMGKTYLCEKIQVTITEKGMSKMMKGDFYRVI